MTFLVALLVLVMLWMGITVLLLGGLWVLPPLLPAPQSVSSMWLWRFLRGGSGVCGTLRIGALMTAVIGWYRTAGFPFSPHIQNSLSLLLGIAVLVAMFNVGRRIALSPTEEMVFCGALGGGWMGMLTLGLYWLLFS